MTYRQGIKKIHKEAKILGKVERKGLIIFQLARNYWR